MPTDGLLRGSHLQCVRTCSDSMTAKHPVTGVSSHVIADCAGLFCLFQLFNSRIIRAHLNPCSKYIKRDTVCICLRLHKRLDFASCKPYAGIRLSHRSGTVQLSVATSVRFPACVAQPAGTYKTRASECL